jgi:hypothetical protein
LQQSQKHVTFVLQQSQKRVTFELQQSQKHVTFVLQQSQKHVTFVLKKFHNESMTLKLAQNKYNETKYDAIIMK